MISLPKREEVKRRNHPPDVCVPVQEDVSFHGVHDTEEDDLHLGVPGRIEEVPRHPELRS